MGIITVRNLTSISKTVQNVSRVLQRKQFSIPKTLNLQTVRQTRNLPSLAYQTVLFSTNAKVSPKPSRVSVANDNTSECVELKWNGSETQQYPYLWLRDNCQCPNCYNASSMSRRLLMRDLDPKSAPVEIKVSFHWLTIQLLKNQLTKINRGRNHSSKVFANVFR